MMYCSADLDQAKRRAKRALIQALFLLAAGLAGMIAGLIWRVRYLAMAAPTVLGMAAYFWFAMKVQPERRYARHIGEILQGLSRESACRFESISGETRLTEEGVGVRDLTALSERGETLLFYWDADRTPPPLAPGQAVTLTAHDRYIIGIKPA